MSTTGQFSNMDEEGSDCTLIILCPNITWKIFLNTFPCLFRRQRFAGLYWQMYSINNGQILIWCIFTTTIRVKQKLWGWWDKLKVMDEDYPVKSHNFFLQEIVHPYFGLLWRICFLFCTIKSSQSILCLGSSILAVSWPGNPRIHVLLEVQPIRTPAVARDSYSVDEPIREFLKSSRTGQSVVKYRFALSLRTWFQPFFRRFASKCLVAFVIYYVRDC